MNVIKKILYKIFKINMYNKKTKQYILEACIGIVEDDE